MTDRRTTSYRAPLSEGERRYRLVRFNVSTPPELFERIRQLALDRDQSMSQTASDLLAQALRAHE